MAFDELCMEGTQAKFLDNNTVLLNQFDSIAQYTLNTGEKSVIYHGNQIDYFCVSDNNIISITEGNHIFIFNPESNTAFDLVQDNGSTTHSLEKNGEILVYSNIDGLIKSINLSTGETNVMFEGFDPIMFGSMVSYKKDGKLHVKDIQSKKEYIYSGSAYSYCFSPDGKYLLIEDEISVKTAMKNLLKKDVVIGHSLVVWEFENDKQYNLVDSCVAMPDMVCDWT